MNKYKRKRFFIVLLVLFVSIGFAALAASLYINGTAIFKQPKVNVYFANPLVSSGSSSTDLPTITNKTTLNYSANLEPGDYYEFTVDVVNDSSLDTVIKSISISATDGTNTIEVPSFLEVTYEYSDGNKIYRNQLLPGKSSKNIRVKVECLQQNEYEEFSGTLQFNIEYNFDDGTGVEVGRNEVCYNNINVEVPAGTVCKRATALHTEECRQTDSTNYCSGAGYTLEGSKGTFTITYGTCGTLGSAPVAGDAFDCDVDNSGTFDEDERFYYISDTGSNEGYATLIYYKNVGTANYYSSMQNYNGPVALLNTLPSTSEWSNANLNTGMTRQILNEKGAATSSYGSYTLPNYTYTDRAARLLTTQEVESVCGITVGSFKLGELDGCQYLLEKTTFAPGSTYGSWWLESPRASLSSSVWFVSSDKRYVFNGSANNTYGVRPAIEVDKTKIAY